MSRRGNVIKKIYIVTTYTGTVLSRLIRKFSNVPYPHVSLSMNNTLDEMYSLGRKFTYTPFIAGFVIENKDRGLYRIKPKTKCRVYTLSIDDNQYDNLEKLIDNCLLEKNSFKYDALQLITLFLNIKMKNEKKKFVCSTFVAWLLTSCNIEIFDKSYDKITPLDFYQCTKINLEYEGLLKNYDKSKLISSGSSECV